MKICRLRKSGVYVGPAGQFIILQKWELDKFFGPKIHLDGTEVYFTFHDSPHLLYFLQGWDYLGEL